MTMPNAKYTRTGVRSGHLRGVAPRVVVGLALIVISIISASAVLKGRTSPVSVLVFAREITAGARLGEGDLVDAAVAGSPDTLGHFVPSGEKASVVGMRLQRSVRAGEPVVRSSLSPEPAVERVVALRVTVPGSSPDLSAGETVDVVATFAADSEDARTVVVASGVMLVSISQAAGEEVTPRVGGAGPGAVESDGMIAAVEVGGRDLVPLVYASQNGVISLVRSVKGEDLAGQQASAYLPDGPVSPEE